MHRFSRTCAQVSIVILTLCQWIAAPNSLAQTGGKGTIQGTVTDPTGAVVRGAEVTVDRIETTESHTQKTTGAGFFSIGSLNPGSYTLRIVAPGFRTFVQENLPLDALQVFGLNARLTIGASSETVTITDAPPPLNTSNATLGNTIEQESYDSLPLSQGGAPRDPTAFVFLTAGVASSSAPYGGFNGGQGFHNENYLEGIAVTNAAAAGGGNTASIVRGVSVDAVDQFQVQTAGTSAAFQGQGVENFTLKSGTNTFHGRAFEYFRNTVLDTWGYFSKAQINQVTGLAIKPVERQNEFGGTFGGPVLIPHLFDGRKKLFFFFSYDGQRYLKGTNPSYLTVPTSAQRIGDFSAAGNQPLYDPLTTTCNANGSNCTRTQFVSDSSNVSDGIPIGTKNVIPKSRFSPQMLYYQNYIPTPSNANLTNNYLSGFNTGFNYYKYSIKVDYDVTQKDRITVLFLTGNRLANPPCCDGSGLPPPFTNTVGNFQYFPTGIIEETHTINDHWVNQFKYAIVRSQSISTNPGQGSPAFAATAAGIANILPGQASMAAPRMGFSGNNSPTSLGGTANSNNQANSEYSNSFVLYDTMQFVKGRHSMNFGGQYQWLEDNDTTLTTGTYLNLNYTASDTASFLANSNTVSSVTGAPYASFLLGAVDNLSEPDNRQVLTTGARYYTFSPFFQDDFKVHPRLTLNLGVRWDLYAPYREVLNRLSFLDPNAINPITGTHGAVTYAGMGPGTCNCNRASQIPYKNFGPRVGFAYAVTPRTVLRGAYALSFTHDGGVGGRNGARQGASLAGFTSNNSVTAATAGTPSLFLNATNSALPAFALPTTTPAFATGYNTTPGYTAAGQGVTFVDPYLSKRAPYYENFNLGVQQELSKQLTLSIDYTGSAGRFLQSGEGNGVNSDQVDPMYNALKTLYNLPATPVNVAAVQAVFSNYHLPYPTFSTAYSIAQSLRPYPQYSGVTDIYGDFGKSSYNSMQVVLVQKPRAGLSYTFNYTWSKLIDTTGTGRTAYNHQYERSLGLFDHPQNISAYAVYEEPFGRGNRFVDKLIKGYLLSGVYTFTSGTPLAITETGCVTVPSGTCEPNLNPTFTGPVQINGQWGRGSTAAALSSVPFIAATAFSVPANYTYGNAVRTAPYGLLGPGGYNLNASLRRTFGLFENLTLLMEIDAFNLTNRTNFSNPAVALGSASFGTITSTANSSRDLQLAARLNF